MTDNSTNPEHKSEAYESVRETGKSLKDDAVHAAEGVRDRVTEEAQARADGAKDYVADEVSSVGKALRDASSELRGGSPQEQLFSVMADGLADFADSVRGKSVGDLVTDVGDFGRRNPVAFLGGAALLGFAGARLAKASARGTPKAAVGPAVDPAREPVGERPGATRTAPAAPGTTPVHPQVGEGV
ncbi:hypothetical protein ACXN5S_02480 [Pseudoroseicyclus sp. H15]